MISFMWQSCNCERAASHLNIVKSNQRTLLGDDTLDDVLFNTINMPEIHEINFDRAVEAWQNDGRKLACFKNQLASSEGSRSKVVRRQLATTTPTFLYK